MIQNGDGSTRSGWYTAGNDGWLRVLNDSHLLTGGEVRGGALRSMGQSYSNGRLNAYEYVYAGRDQEYYTVMRKSLYAGNVGQGYTCCGVW